MLFLNGVSKDDNNIDILKSYFDINNNKQLAILHILKKKLKKVYKDSYLKLKILAFNRANYKHINTDYLDNKEFSKIFMDICRENNTYYYDGKNSKCYKFMPSSDDEDFIGELKKIYSNENIINIIKFLYSIKSSYHRDYDKIINYIMFIGYCFRDDYKFQEKIFNISKGILNNLLYYSAYKKKYDCLINSIVFKVDYNLLYINEKEQSDVIKQELNILKYFVENVLTNFERILKNGRVIGIALNDFGEIFMESESTEEITGNIQKYTDEFIKKYSD